MRNLLPISFSSFLISLALFSTQSFASSFAPVSNNIASPHSSSSIGSEPTTSTPLLSSVTPSEPQSSAAADVETLKQTTLPVPVVEQQQQQQQQSSVDLSPSSPLPDATSAVQLCPGLGPNASPPGWLRRKFPTFPWHRVPNMLTYARFVAIPALIALFYTPGRHVETGLLFAGASFTDWLDGYLARKWDISSAFGAFLDPVADKLMVSTSLILLSGWYGALVVIPTCIILSREIAISALREWMAQRGQRDIVKVGFQGKLKTALTMLSLTFLLLVPTSDKGSWLKYLEVPGLAMLYLCMVITITSGSVYFRAALPYLLNTAPF